MVVVNKIETKIVIEMDFVEFIMRVYFFLFYFFNSLTYTQVVIVGIALQANKCIS